MKILDLEQIKAVLPALDLMPDIESGFVAYSEGRAVVPPVGELVMQDPPGDVHIKYGYLAGDDYYVIKIASGFYGNAALGLPTSNGLMLLFDYGVSRREYYSPDRNQGWLRCHFRHHAHNEPLIYAGIQDLTSWVDFTAVAEAAEQHGLDVKGFVTQADFLIGGGLEDELAGISESPIADQLELSRQVKLLTLPGEMGEHFKCIGLSRGKIAGVEAFGAADRAHIL